jgi:hypothetical protein
MTMTIYSRYVQRQLSNRASHLWKKVETSVMKMKTMIYRIDAHPTIHPLLLHAAAPPCCIFRYFYRHSNAQSGVAPLCAMSVSDENAPPCAGQTSKARRRRTNSLFQVEGGSLLDIIGEGNLPFLLPDKPIYPNDAALAPANGLLGSVDGACQQLLQLPPPAPAAVSDVIAVNAVNAPSAAPAVVPSAAPAVVPPIQTRSTLLLQRRLSGGTLSQRCFRVQFLFSQASHAASSSPLRPPTLSHPCCTLFSAHPWRRL